MSDTLERYNLAHILVAVAAILWLTNGLASLWTDTETEYADVYEVVLWGIGIGVVLGALWVVAQRVAGGCQR